MNLYSTLFDTLESTVQVNKNKHNPDHINYYHNLGWKKVCTVKSQYFGNDWFYEEIDETLMYSNHRSWIYAITVDGVIQKIGETERPLGIKSKKTNQPITGTKSRLGRYRTHKASSCRESDTDETIRDSLRRETQDPNKEVAFYAIKCPEVFHKFKFLNEEISIPAQIHKRLEKFLLDYYFQQYNEYPPLNVGRA